MIVGVYYDLATLQERRRLMLDGDWPLPAPEPGEGRLDVAQDDLAAVADTGALIRAALGAL